MMASAATAAPRKAAFRRFVEALPFEPSGDAQADLLRRSDIGSEKSSLAERNVRIPKPI